MIPGVAIGYRVAFNIINILIVGFIILPVIAPVAVSFSSLPFLSFPPVGFSLKWYDQAIHNSEFLASVWLSLKLAAAATCTALPLGTLAALGLAKSTLPGKATLQALILSPLIFPMLITGLALLQLFSEYKSTQTFFNLWIGHVVITVPYVLRTVTAGLQTIDPVLEAAAKTLGANRIEVFFRVTFPQLRGALFGGTLFSFIASFDNFPVTLWLKDSEFTPFPLQIYSFIARYLDPSIAAMSTLMIAISLVVIVATEKIFGLRRFMSS